MDISSVELTDMSMICLEMAACDVVDLYSPPRYTAMASAFGLKRGFAADLSTGWDFDKEGEEEKLLKELEWEDPFLGVGTPPCNFMTQILNIMKNRMSPERREELRATGRRHLKTACAA